MSIKKLPIDCAVNIVGVMGWQGVSPAKQNGVEAKVALTEPELATESQGEGCVIRCSTVIFLKSGNHLKTGLVVECKVIYSVE